ncbi:MAG: CAP domain-containing protein [Thermoproteota archaeon]
MKSRSKLSHRREALLVIISSVVISSILQLNITSCKADLESEKTAFLALINQYRQQNGLPPLSVSSVLMTAAQQHSEDMAARDYFSHTTPEGKTFVDRIRDAGYNYSTCLGENIAAGYSTAQTVFEAWRNSPSHDQNMLNYCFKAIGIGLAYNPSSTYKWYWTTDFGGYDDSGGSPPPPPPPPPGGNNPPSTPTEPSGPRLGHVDESYTFTTSSVDPDGDLLSYTFDWDDGTFSTTSYVASGILASLSHSWSIPGNYSIRVMVKDTWGACSSWSSSATIRIIIPIFQVNFTSNIPDMILNVDGVNYSMPKTFEWLKGDVHNASVEEIHQFMDKRRYCFKGWSDGVNNKTRKIIVNNSFSLTAIYEVQYIFSFKTQPDNFTSKWYAAGTVISLSAEPVIIELNHGERLVFKRWSNNASSTTIEITVNEPGFIEAMWGREFLLRLNSPYGDLNGGGWHDEGSTVNLSVCPSIIELENGTKRVFESWIGEGLGSYSGVEPNTTMVIRGPINESAVWRTEYRVMVETEYGDPFGVGWYNVSSTTIIYLEPVVYESQGVRHVFQGWKGDVESSNHNITITVDSPLILKAIWQTEFYLNVSSEYGEVWGGGWYANDSYASFGVKPPPPSLISYVFEGWTGDVYASSLNVTTVMDEPKNIVAKWRKDYTWLIMTLIVVSIIPIAINVRYSKSKRVS